MPARLATSTVLLLLVAVACAGPAASGPGGTTPPAAATPGGGTETAAAIDLSKVDACAIVPAGTAERLTGEKDFTADGSSSASRAHCFWGVPRAGVPQYLEVTIERRTASLQGYKMTFNGVACPGASVAAAGAEAVGAVCSGSQTKVWLAAMDRGVAVHVLVNEPLGTLTPGDLAATAQAVLAGLE